MGNMLTRYPRLYGAIASHMALLDMQRIHTFPQVHRGSWIADHGDPYKPTKWT